GELPQLRQSIWVHAVSVGEVKSVERLLEGLRRQFPEKPLVVSTVTPAGQMLARERGDIIDHTFYFPIDLPWCVSRVVDRMQSEMDRRRIEAIVADPQKVTVFGNLKYDVDASGKPVDAGLARFLDNWHQIWIAASTMPGEEEGVLDSFSQLLKKHSNLKLIIAPRHADRFQSVQQIVKNRGFICVRRTQLSDAGNVLLLDT